VRFSNSVGAVVQVLMRSDIPAAEALFRDHLRISPTGQKFRRPLRSGVQDGRIALGNAVNCAYTMTGIYRALHGRNVC
jgi:hypothetical protein